MQDTVNSQRSVVFSNRRKELRQEKSLTDWECSTMKSSKNALCRNGWNDSKVGGNPWKVTLEVDDGLRVWQQKLSPESRIFSRNIVVSLLAGISSTCHVHEIVRNRLQMRKLTTLSVFLLNDSQKVLWWRVMNSKRFANNSEKYSRRFVYCD